MFDREFDRLQRGVEPNWRRESQADGSEIGPYLESVFDREFDRLQRRVEPNWRRESRADRSEIGPYLGASSGHSPANFDKLSLT